MKTFQNILPALVITLFFVLLSSCGGGSASGGNEEGAGTSGTEIQLASPELNSIKGSIAENNPNGIIPGQALGSITLPTCAENDDLSLITYSIEGLPAWLSFDSSTRTLSLADGYSVIPDEVVDLVELTYTCSLQVSATVNQFKADTLDQLSISFALNDLDGDGSTDGREYELSEIPLLNESFGLIDLNTNNVGLYRSTTFSSESVLRRVPTGLTVPIRGMDPTDPTDVLEDFDGDGIVNGDEINSGTNIFIAQSPGTFNSPVGYYSDQVTGIASADFDRDGNIDLATTHIVAEEISIAFGYGDGSFLLSPPLDMTGHKLHNLISGDVDYDADYDLIVCANEKWNTDNDYLMVLINSGKGTFAISSTLPLTISCGNLALTSINNDGILDIVATSTSISNAVQIFIGAGDGTFTPGNTLTAGVPVTGAPIPEGLVTADFNEDGNIDIVTCNLRGISSYLGHGDGTFDQPNNYDYLSSGIHPQGSITAADYDNNRTLDIGIAAFNEILFLRGKGDGTFEPPVSSTWEGSTVQVKKIIAGDFNGDGNDDLFGIYDGFQGQATFFIGTGDGAFVKDDAFTVDYAGRLTAADFDNDGDIDVATSNFDTTTGMSVLINQ